MLVHLVDVRSGKPDYDPAYYTFTYIVRKVDEEGTLVGEIQELIIDSLEVDNYKALINQAIKSKDSGRSPLRHIGEEWTVAE